MTYHVDFLASSLNGDWRALLRARVNVLVTGPRTSLEEFMNLCREELRQPLVFASPGRPLPLHASDTLVVSDVHLLDDAAQHTLAAWVCDPEHANTQVMSLTSTPLFALVDEGLFDRDLYYYLNTVHLQLTEATEVSTMLIGHPCVA